MGQPEKLRTREHLKQISLKSIDQCSSDQMAEYLRTKMTRVPRGHAARLAVTRASSYRDANVRRVPWRLTSPHEFFTRRAEDFMAYLHLSRAGFKPPSDLNVPFDPG